MEDKTNKSDKTTLTVSVIFNVVMLVVAFLLGYLGINAQTKLERYDKFMNKICLHVSNYTQCKSGMEMIKNGDKEFLEFLGL